MRFVKNTAVTNDGEITEKKIGNSYTTEQIIETLRLEPCELGKEWL